MSSNNTHPSYSPEYVNESSLAGIMAPMAVLHAIALVVVSCRLYTRLRITKSFAIDDWIIALALAFTFGSMITFIGQAYNGLGRHQSILSPHEFEMFTIWGLAQIFLATLGAIGALKISIAFSLLRLSGNKWFRLTLYLLIG